MILYSDRTTSPGDWSAVGFSKNGGMKKADIYACKRLGEKQNFTTAYSPTETRPTEYQLNYGFSPGIVNQRLEPKGPDDRVDSVTRPVRTSTV